MASHRVNEDWMGSDVETLEDLVRPGLRAICVGINPSPVSVQAGHYYQGRLGRLFFSRLIEARAVPSASNEFMDDVAYRSGVGFTDIVKRPTRAAKDVRAEEFDHGRELLIDKIENASPSLVIFTFKATALKIFGRFPGNGFVDLKLGQSEVFVMPGPYEDASTAKDTLLRLKDSLS